jgi:hypothetical protein
MTPHPSSVQGVEIVDTQDLLEVTSDWCPLAPDMAPSSYAMQVFTTIEAIEALRPVWKMWAHSLDTDFDYFLHTLTHDASTLHPCVIAVYDGSVPRAMLVGQVRTRRASAVVSFLNIPGPRERVLTIHKGGRLGQPSSLIDKLLASELLKIAKSGMVDALSFERLSLQSELLRHIQRMRGFLVKECVPHVFYYSVLTLRAQGKNCPSVFTGKAQREVRRKTRILDSAFPDKVQLKCFSHPEELDMGLRDALRVAGTTWQYHLGEGLAHAPQAQVNFEFFARQGWLRIYILYIKESPCAYLVGQLYNHAFYCQHAGFNPNFAHFSVGSVLTARAFEELAAAGVRQVDLGEGGQEHNRRLGCEKSEEGTVHIYSPTLRGVWLSLFFLTTRAVRKGGRRMQAILHLYWLSRIWRQYLLSRWQSQHPSSELDV